MTNLRNDIRRHRERAQLSQRALADEVGVSRQAVSAIEAGRQVPSTELALRIALALGTSVEELFQLVRGATIRARVCNADAAPGVGDRVVVGRGRDGWVAHRASGPVADGIVAAAALDAVEVRPFGDARALERNVLVAGCAPVLATLEARTPERFSDVGVRWVPASSEGALDLLADDLVHVAGLHLVNSDREDANPEEVRRRFERAEMVLVNLTRWTQGILVAPGNPRAIAQPQDLLVGELNFAHRSAGAGANKLLWSRLGDEAAGLNGPTASGHAEVARFVQYGLADAGIAIESEAIAAGLDFVPLSEERFDLVLPLDALDARPVTRMLDTLTSGEFREEVRHMPGYDATETGSESRLGPQR